VRVNKTVRRIERTSSVGRDDDRHSAFCAPFQDFENIENEWPLFYLYMIIDGVFKNLPQQVDEYRALLKDVMMVDSFGGRVQERDAVRLSGRLTFRPSCSQIRSYRCSITLPRRTWTTKRRTREAS